jgi:hypothetical protein
MSMSTSCEKQSNLARSLNELYDNQLPEGESQSASRYLVDFFKILDTVNTRQNLIKASKGRKANDHHRSPN